MTGNTVPLLIDLLLPPTPGGSAALRAVLGVPVGQGPWPAVVLVHEAFGLAGMTARARPACSGSAWAADSVTRLSIPHDVKEYPGAGHAFLNDAETGPVALRFLLKRILGAGPNPVAAADAWQRIEAFFGEHLTPEC